MTTRSANFVPESGYETLNDVAKGYNIDAFVPGNVEIWYLKWHAPSFKGRGTLATAVYIDNWEPRISDLHDTHILIGKIYGPLEYTKRQRVKENTKFLDHIFMLMQGEEWSPQGEAYNLIRRLNADHTSMSVGDVIKIGERAWMVSPIGFSALLL